MDDLTNWLSFPLCLQPYLSLFPLLLFLCRQLERACGRDERRDEKREEKKREEKEEKRGRKKTGISSLAFPFITGAASHTGYTTTPITHYTLTHRLHTFIYTQ